MRRVFADTLYWIALVNRHDQWHQKVVEASEQLGPAQLVTTDEVLDEFLAHFCGGGNLVRERCAQQVRNWLNSVDIHVLAQTHDSFLGGLSLYEARLDKAYSLTDCISMITMRHEGINEVLTRDAHFMQEGFTLLL